MATVKNNLTTALKQIGMGVGLTAVAASAALAAPIGSFDYSQEFEFTSATPLSVIGSGGVNPGNINGNTKLEWGTEFNEFDKVSSLVINPVGGGDNETPSNLADTGNVVVSQDINAITFAPGPVLVHNNYVITGSSLTAATAEDYVVLTPALPDVGPDQVQEVMFSVDFLETTNSLTGAACPSGNENAAGCGDIFVLGTGELGAPTLVNGGQPAFLIDSFIRDDYLYQVFLQEVSGNIGVLDDPACAAVGAPLNCIGFTTAENEENFFALQFGILATERQIPAPATLFLMGGSLLSLAWMRRRKAARKAS
tara:strand:- start:26075 stop:27004 length:930 start_codon:yes stop_codon:yes gene_type:complete